jgi:hypothetical protein
MLGVVTWAGVNWGPNCWAHYSGDRSDILEKMVRKGGEAKNSAYSRMEQLGYLGGSFS